MFGTFVFADDGLREAEADTSINPLFDSFKAAGGGEGGIKVGGGAFNPAILPSEINFRKLQKSSFSSSMSAEAAAEVGLSIGMIGGGGGGGGGIISSVQISS